MSSRTFYTVIIPAYNAASTIENTLRSVLQQSLHAKRIIVVNDASTDGTLEVLKNFPVEIISNTTNEGSAASRNKALSEIADGVIAIVDADDTWDVDYGEHMMQMWKKAPANIGAIGMLMRPVGIVSTQGFKRQNRRMFKKGLSVISPLDLAWHNPFYASTTSFDADKIKSIGGWGEIPYSFSEDYSLLARLMVNGSKLLINPIEMGNYSVSLTQKSAQVALQYKSEIEVCSFILDSSQMEETYLTRYIKFLIKLGIWIRAVLRSINYGSYELPSLSELRKNRFTEFIDLVFRMKYFRKVLNKSVKVIEFLRA